MKKGLKQPNRSCNLVTVELARIDTAKGAVIIMAVDKILIAIDDSPHSEFVLQCMY